MRLGFRSLIIAILALWRDLSWKQVAVAVGWTPDRLSKILRRKEMAERDFERLLPHVRNRPAEVLVAARCIEDLEALEREPDLTDEEQEEVERGVLEASRALRAVLVDRVRRSRGVPAWDEYPDPSEVEPAAGGPRRPGPGWSRPTSSGTPAPIPTGCSKAPPQSLGQPKGSQPQPSSTAS